MGYVALACRLALGLVFTVSAVTKLHRPGAYRAFRASLRQLGLLPRALVGPAAVLTAATEVAIVALMAVPAASLAGFALAAVLLVAFSAAITWSLRRGVNATCRCFGRSRRPLGAAHLVRNALLLAVTATGAAAALGAGEDAAMHLAGAMVAAGAGVAVAVVAATFDDLVDLFFPPARPGPAPTRTR